MSLQSGEGPSPREMKRVDAFLDCIARLLAKRWLRDQRRQEEPSQKEERKPPGEEE